MAKEPTKVVVRLLPPLITEDELLSTIGEEHVGNAPTRTFIAGKRHKGDKPSRNALCYFYFGSGEQAEAFIKDYHGHQFVDDQGEQFRAVACFAPYQKVPKQRSGKDPREGTIEDDPGYQQFVESLSKPKEAFVAPEDPKMSLKPSDPKNTPLLQHLKKRAEEKQARAEKRTKKKWRPDGEDIAEDGVAKRPKWRCGECGTSKHLEEDPDDRGSFYCTRCWESWESAAVAKPKKKKKKKGYDYEEEAYEEAYEEPASRKSRKKREKQAAAAAEAEWGAEWQEQETEGRRHRRKKKDKDAQWHEESWAEADGSSWWTSEPSAEKEKKSKSKKERGGDRWVPVEEKKAEDDTHGRGGGSRWKKKGDSETGGEREEKPRRSRKEKSWY